MKVLVFAAFLFAAVTAIPEGFQLYRRTTGFAEFFGELGEPLATEIATKVAATKIDPAAAITAVDPKATWAAVKAIAGTLAEKAVPAKCTGALVVHAVTGFARHMVLKVVMKDLIHTVQECAAEEDIAKMAAAIGAAAGTAGAAGGAAGAAGGAAAAAAGGAIIAADIDAVIAAIMGAIDAKIAPLTADMGDAHLEKAFTEIQATIDAAVAMNKPVGVVLKALAMAAHKHLAAFGTTVSCDVASKIDAADAAINAILDYLGGGFVATMDTVALPKVVKDKLVKNFTPALGAIAATVTTVIKADKGDLAAFIMALLEGTAAELHKGIAIAKIAEQIMADGKLVAFADAFVKDGKTKEALEMILKTIALTMGDFDVPPEMIKGFLVAIEHTVTAEKFPTLQDRIFFTLTAAAAAGAASAVGSNVANEVLGWLG